MNGLHYQNNYTIIHHKHHDTIIAYVNSIKLSFRSATAHTNSDNCAYLIDGFDPVVEKFRSDEGDNLEQAAEHANDASDCSSDGHDDNDDDYDNDDVNEAT